MGSAKYKPFCNYILFEVLGIESIRQMLLPQPFKMLLHQRIYNTLGQVMFESF